MSDDIVFKFVSLRAPIANEDETYIEASEDAVSPFMEAFHRNPGHSLKARLLRATEELINSGLDPSKESQWQKLYLARLADRLLKTTHPDFQSFREEVTTQLNKFGLKVDDPGFHSKLWLGYLNSIFSKPGDGLWASFFHRWLHIHHLIGLESIERKLPLFRIALPPGLSAQLPRSSRSLTNPGESPPPVINPASMESLAKSYHRLELLIDELSQLQNEKRKEVVESRADQQGELLPTTVQPKRPQSRNEASTESSTSTSRRWKPPQVSMLSFFDQWEKKDLSSEAMETLCQENLSPDVTLSALKKQAQNKQSTVYSQLIKQATSSRLHYDNGTFVRSLSLNPDGEN